MAPTNVIENSRNSRSTKPPINRIDKNTTTSARFIATSVTPTSLAPRRAALNGDRPCSRWRLMFSTTTMASSTTRPAATISAITDKLFSEKPNTYMTQNAPINDTGIASVGISATRTLRKNSSTTATTKPIDNSKLNCASSKVARITGLRSITTASLEPSGINASSTGIC